MKWLTILITFSASFACFSQNIQLSPTFYSVEEGNNYHFTISGQGNFSDSLTVEYSIKTADSTLTVLFSGAVNFAEPNVVLPENFTYNSSTGNFSIDLGTVAHKNVVLELRSSSEGEILEYFVISIPQLENVGSPGN